MRDRIGLPSIYVGGWERSVVLRFGPGEGQEKRHDKER